MPIERRTRAPAPSDCSMARKACLIWRGVVMLVGLMGESMTEGKGLMLKNDSILVESEGTRPDEDVAMWRSFKNRVLKEVLRRTK